MKIEVSKYFSEKGYTTAYKMSDSSGRAEVQLFKSGKDSERKCMSYARYLWISEYGDIPEGYEVDHINNDFTDDRLDNLQILTKGDNIRKANSLRYSDSLVKRVCPICGKEFEFPKRNLSTHPNPCCSRSCGGKMSHITLAAKKGPNP